MITGALGLSGMAAAPEGGVDGEKAPDVQHPSDEALLEQDLARASVRGLAHPVPLTLPQLALDHRPASQLAARRRPSLLGTCRMQARLVEVERDGATVGAGRRTTPVRLGREPVSTTTPGMPTVTTV
jgi:hypothetical protein